MKPEPMTDERLLRFKVSDIDTLNDEIRRLREENERLIVQLAGCSCAALGAGDKAQKGDYGWSPAYQDTLDLRKKYEKLCKELQAEKDSQCDACAENHHEMRRLHKENERLMRDGKLRRCDIPACNCNGFHSVYASRMSEYAEKYERARELLEEAGILLTLWLDKNSPDPIEETRAFLEGSRPVFPGTGDAE